MRVISAYLLALCFFREGLTREEVTHGLDHLSAASDEECPASLELECADQKYASYDGTCNNVEHAQWGSANSSFSRFLTPIYEDGKYTVHIEMAT